MLLVFMSSAFAVELRPMVDKAKQRFLEEDYFGVLTALEDLEKAIKKNKKAPKKTVGFLYYKRGVTYYKLQEFPKALKSFEKAHKLKYVAKDMYYEYAQALYISDELKKSRKMFKKSVKMKYKIGVSLYYIAYTSQLLKDYKKAVTFFNAIERLPKKERKSVLQAARMQIGDIYLTQVEKMPDSQSAIKKYVIPQYRKSLKVDSGSALGKQVAKKIEDLERKYELALFRMRNGRPVLRPPYYMVLMQNFNQDNNLSSSSDDEIADLEDENAGWYASTTAMGRYTYYIGNYLAVAPDVSITYTKYLVDNDTYKTSNGYSINAGLRNQYEHSLFGKQASILFDYVFGYNANDVDADDNVVHNYDTSTISVGERFTFKSMGETVLKYNLVTSSYADEDDDTSENVAKTFSWSQVINIIPRFTFISYISYTNTEYVLEEADGSDTTATSISLTAIVPRVIGLVPSLNITRGVTNYVNDDESGKQTLTSYNLSVTKNFSAKFNATFGYTYSSNVGVAPDAEDTEESDLGYTKGLFSVSGQFIF